MKADTQIDRSVWSPNDPGPPFHQPVHSLLAFGSTRWISVLCDWKLPSNGRGCGPWERWADVTLLYNVPYHFVPPSPDLFKIFLYSFSCLLTFFFMCSYLSHSYPVLLINTDIWINPYPGCFDGSNKPLIRNRVLAQLLDK